MFYYIPSTFNPNTAATNRTISFIKGFACNNVKTTVVFFRPNNKYDEFEFDDTNINIKRFWSRNLSTNILLRYLAFLTYYLRFIVSLKKDDTILLTGNAEILNLLMLLKKKVHIYIEHTENPEIVGIGGKFLTPSFEKYYKYLQRIDGMFVITTALKDFFVSKGVDSKKIHIANITVDPERFMNLSKKNDIEDYVAYCGSVSNDKDGVDQLIQSFAIFSKDFPNVKLYIIGPILKSESLKNIRLIESLGLVEKIVLTGVVSADKIPQLLKDAKLLLLDRPNNMQANCGFATKIGEYLLTKNPIVLTKVGDFSLFFEDRKNIIFSQPDDINDFADNMKWAYSNLSEAKNIGEAGYEVAMQEFTYNAVVSKINNIIKV